MMLHGLQPTLVNLFQKRLALAVPPPEGGFFEDTPWMSIAVISVIALAAIVVIVALVMKGKERK